MAHMTRKKAEQRRINNLKRATNGTGMKTFTRCMGFNSNQDRKDYLFNFLAKKEA